MAKTRQSVCLHTDQLARVIHSKDFITMNKPLLFTVPALFCKNHSASREERNLTGILAKLHFFIKSSLAKSIPRCRSTRFLHSMEGVVQNLDLDKETKRVWKHIFVFTLMRVLSLKIRISGNRFYNQCLPPIIII